MMSIAENIKYLRKKAGLTQVELANKTGLAVITIQNYEAGKYEPKRESIYKLRKALDCNINELLDAPFIESKNNIIINSTNPDDIMAELEKHFPNIREMQKREHDWIVKGKASAREYNLLTAFDKLNEQGQEKAIERVEELTEIPKYQITDDTGQDQE
nr:MAG TPA: helix-turn-helix domain protein [Bacteriophage sp.]